MTPSVITIHGHSIYSCYPNPATGAIQSAFRWGVVPGWDGNWDENWNENRIENCVENCVEKRVEKRVENLCENFHRFLSKKKNEKAAKKTI